MAQNHSNGYLDSSVSALAHWINQLANALHDGIFRRMDSLGNAATEWSAMLAGMRLDGHDPKWTLALVVASALGGIAALLGAQRIVDRSGAPFGPIVRAVLSILLAALVVVLVTRLVTSDAATRHLIILWADTAIVALTGRRVLKGILAAAWASALARRRLRLFEELISLSFIWGVFGLTAVATLRSFNAGHGLLDGVATFLVSVPTTAVTVFAYLRFRMPVMADVAGPAPRTPLRLRFAAMWPYLAATAAIVTLLALEISVTIGHPLPGLPLLLTLLLVLLAPHIDASLAEWARAREQAATDSAPRAALYRTSRFAFILAALIALGSQWTFPALSALGVQPEESEWRIFWLALVMLIAAWAWNVTGIGFERMTHRERRGANHGEDAHAPHTRLETLFPLLGGTARTFILLVALLTVLLILGMNVWPIITGLSVFGLAISFGSQTLVKDIVSGLFFLIDDAFRMGEYVETSGAKGTVERISVRSVSLRHPRGAVATIPYGQIGKIQNFSRDWVIEKLVFRVPFDTDVEQVRKLFKQIGAGLAADPDVADDLLETFKSQGITAVEDGTLLVRGKFMARAGKQFTIRKKVFQQVQQTFRENGIVVVSKPMFVAHPVFADAVPDGVQLSQPPDGAPQQPRRPVQPQPEAAAATLNAKAGGSPA